MKKAATIIYAVGWTQHTFGTQIIRTAAMLQLLLGNVGRAGGGVNALRGHSNIQGATDMAGIFDILPGYLKVPMPTDKTSRPTSSAVHPSRPSQRVGFVQLLVEHAQVCRFAPQGMYGDAAKKENDWAFHYLPKIDRNYSWVEHLGRHVPRQRQRHAGFGMNGVVIGPELAEEYRRAEKGGLAGGGRDLSR